MARYAETTTVTIEKSKAEIEGLIRKAGARKVATAYDEDNRLAVLQFELNGRRLLFRLQLPDEEEERFRLDARWRERSDSAWRNAYDQECRRLWRSLLLVVKAKLESVASGVETLEEAFLAQIVVPGAGGFTTYGDFAIPQIERVYETNELPPLLSGLSSGDIKQLGSGR